MSQHDMNIANSDGATVRSDINSALSAIVSLNSGASAPSTTFAYQWWADTTNNLLKQRNAADSAWLTVGPLAGTVVLAKTAAYTVALGDFGKMIDADASGGDFTLTLPAAATAGDGFTVAVKNTGSSGTVTIDGDGSETVDGATTVALSTQYAGLVLRCDGSEWFVEAERGLGIVGKHTIWIPAGAMRPTVSDGCDILAEVETTAGNPDINVLDFDATADEHAQFSIAFPKSWNEGTITFYAFWTSIATGTTGVAWRLQGVATADDDPIDVSYGASQIATDNIQSAAEDCLVTVESPAITIAGSPAAEELCHFRVFRDVSDANDDMTEDARLLGIKLIYNINAGNDD